MAEVRVDTEKRKIMIRAAGHEEMSVLLLLPSRRWLKRQQMFVVPATPANCEQLLLNQVAGRIVIDAEPLEYIQQQVHRNLGDRKFPEWYAFKTQPFPDQRNALAKTFRNDAIALFMRMGTGKSKVIIDTATALFYQQHIQAVVLICPLAVKAVWMGNKGQLADHSPCPYIIVDVDSDFDWTDIPPRQDRLVWLFVGIESFSQGKTFDRLLPYLQQYKCMAAIDESSRIKNDKAIRTERAKAIGRAAKTRLISTGTPATKNIIDLYSQFDFLDPNIIGTGDMYAFRNRYCIMGGYKKKDILGYDHVDELMSLIEPYTYRCDKPKGMPEQLWQHRDLKMADEQLEMYRKVRKGEIREVKVANVLNRMGKLQEIAGGFLREDPKEVAHPITGRIVKVQGKLVWQLPADKNPKILELHNQIEEMGDEQVVIWCKYLWEIEQVAEALSRHGPTAKMWGESTGEERIQIKDDFQEGKIRFLVANQQIGGIGHTFTASHLAYYYSNTNSLEDRLQSEDRIHRTGQDENCLYTDLLCAGTVDYTIFGSIGEKKDLDVYIREKLDAAVDKAKALAEIFGDA